MFDAVLKAELAPIRSELSWHKWLMLAIVGAIVMPKLGGPDPKEATEAAQVLADPNLLHTLRALLASS